MVDVLIPTYNRPEALATTLLSLCWQSLRDFRVIISDQSDRHVSTQAPAVTSVLRLFRSQGIPVSVHRHLPPAGIAENRNFLLRASDAGHCLFLDDDIILEPDMLRRLLAMIRRQECGFVGSAPIGLSYMDDVRPHEQAIEFWEGRVTPERVRPQTAQWQRHKLHNAANIYHLQRRLGIAPAHQRAYKIAWIGSCVLFESGKLRACGGFGFWRELPENVCGEDVYAQIRVMERYGGCGLIPSGAYHQELPTTIPDRSNNAVSLL